MNWGLFAQLVVTFAVATMGWWAAHTLSARRDVTNERRKLRVTYLLEAYRRLEGSVLASDHKTNSSQIASAIADIQLLGSPSQVKMAVEFTKLLASHESQECLSEAFHKLLLDLRQSLRTELQLESVNEKIIILHTLVNEPNPSLKRDGAKARRPLA